jgi:hypothetical protein
MDLIQDDNLQETDPFSQGASEADGFGKLPLVATLGFDDLTTYTVTNHSDAERLIGTAHLPAGWLHMPADDLEPLMPRLLMGLQYALKHLCHARQGVYFESFGVESMLDKSLKILLYRCVCELIDNAWQHAGATYILVQLSLGKEVISVTVHDNGKGFTPGTAPAGSGLGNICACVLACNGQLSLFTSEGEGTEITIEIKQTYGTELYNETTHSRPPYDAH